MWLETRTGLRIPEDELEVRCTPSGGPGGQHANRSNTRVELRWDVASSPSLDEDTRRRLVDRLGAVVRVVVDDERSQLRNRGLARERLVARVDGALARRRGRRPTRPTKGSVQRRIGAKRARGELKQQRRRPRRED